MDALILYSLKVSVCLGGIYLFYLSALRNLTFFTWNRWYLLFGSVMAFLIPLVPVLPYLSGFKIFNLNFLNFYQFLNWSIPEVYFSGLPENSVAINYQWVTYLFGMGIIFQTGRLIIQFLSFFRLRHSATRLPGGKVVIYQIDKNIAPFSFWNAIYLNKHLIQPPELESIIQHELVHINQKHTCDVLLMELITLLNWYNPFAWLLKQAVRQNLEFIADNAVLKILETDKKDYQYLLLKIIGLPDFAIANQFNISSLKTRIMMMNKMPCTKHELFKFLFVFPLMGLLLLACQDKADVTFKELSKINSKADLNLDVPPPPPPPLPVEPPPPPPVPTE